MRTLGLALTVLSSLTLVSPPSTATPPATIAAGWSDSWQDLEGMASWYSSEDPGVVPQTASSERFNDRALTCAMWGVPFNTRLRVTNLHNGRSVVVRVNDRGPSETLVLRQNRIIDLTKSAFAALADPIQGLIRVRIELDQPPVSWPH